MLCSPREGWGAIKQQKGREKKVVWMSEGCETRRNEKWESRGWCSCTPCELLLAGTATRPAGQSFPARGPGREGRASPREGVAAVVTLPVAGL